MRFDISTTTRQAEYSCGDSISGAFDGLVLGPLCDLTEEFVSCKGESGSGWVLVFAES
jgi:hypothetical protein